MHGNIKRPTIISLVFFVAAISLLGSIPASSGLARDDTSTALRIDLSPTSTELQAHFESDSPLPSALSPPAGQMALSYSGYYGYSGTVAALNQIHTLYPGITEVFSIGKTREGRDIMALRLTNNPGVENFTKHQVYVDGMTHSREWMTNMVPLYALDYLTSNYGSVSRVTSIVDNLDIVFVPIINPDGRVFDGINDGTNPDIHELWRKNRLPNADGSYGVDLNRNYEFGWEDESYADPEMKSETYRGLYPFSEPETAAIKNLALQNRFVTSASYHSHAQVVYYRPGLSVVPSMAQDIADAAGDSSGYGPMTATVSSGGGGGGVDYGWLFEDRGVIGFNIELPPRAYGEPQFNDSFYPPVEKILPICQDQLEPLLYVIESAYNPFYLEGNANDQGIAKISPFNNESTYAAGIYNMEALFENYGLSPVSSAPVEFELRYDPRGADVLEDTYTTHTTGTLNLNDTQVLQWNHTFTTPGMYRLTVSTTTSDSLSWNNEKSVDFYIDVDPTLGAPTITGLDALSGNLILDWDAPTHDPDVAPIYMYRIYRGTTSGSLELVCNVSGTTFEDTNVSSGVYYYQVSAVNRYGEGALSAEIAANPADELLLPVSVFGIICAGTFLVAAVWTRNKTRNKNTKTEN